MRSVTTRIWYYKDYHELCILSRSFYRLLRKQYILFGMMVLPVSTGTAAVITMPIRKKLTALESMCEMLSRAVGVSKKQVKNRQEIGKQ